MSDLESGLKEAVESARMPRNIVRGDIASGERLYAHANSAPPQGTPSMTAPAIIEHIEALTKSAVVLEELTLELSNDLAGRDTANRIRPAPESPTEGMTIFDRMGVQLLVLTRTIESIEREVKRSLGAVKP